MTDALRSPDPGADLRTHDAAVQAPLVEARAVGRRFTDGQVTALDGIDLQVADGEYIALKGHSGCGKSTLLNLLGGLDQPTSGQILFRGQPLESWGDPARFRATQLGFVFQSFHLVSVLNAVQNVQLPMFETSLSAAQRREKAEHLLVTVGMQHRARHRPGELSVGERQRVAIARALANDPALVLADEPTGNLDTKTAGEIFELFDRLHAAGTTLILVTHDPNLASRADRQLLMRDGRLVGNKPSYPVRSRPSES